ncbi:MAG: AI-2E family transporter [Clostridiaceae bacterium]
MINNSNIYKKIINIILLLLFFIIFSFVIKNYFKPFFIIILFIILGTPIYNILSQFTPINKKVNGVLTLVIINIIIFIFIIFTGGYLFTQIKSLIINNIYDLNKNIYIMLNDIGKIINLDLLPYYKSINLNNFIKEDILKKGAAYTTDGIISYFIGNITAYFILVDKYDIVDFIKAIISFEKFQILKIKFNELNKIIRMEMILLLVSTLITLLGFMILNISNYFSLSIVCGILDILPYIGTILVFLPLIIYYITTKKYLTAVGLLILYILLLVSREIWEAKYMSNSFNIHPLLIILSIYIGGEIFGLVGIFLAPLFMVAAKELILS